MTTVAATEADHGPLPSIVSDKIGYDCAEQYIRFATAALDAVQTAGVGFVTAELLPGVNRVSGAGEVAVVAVMASITAIGLRVGMRAANLAGADVYDGIAAARAAVLAVLFVGVEHRLASTLALPMWLLGVWLLLWGSLTALNAYLLRAVAKGLSRSVGVAPRLFLFGDAEQTGILSSVLTTMPNTQRSRVLRIDDRNPAEIARLLARPVSRDDIVFLVVETLDSARVDDACRGLADFPGQIRLAMRAPPTGPLPRAFPRWGDYMVIDLVTNPHGSARGAVKRLSDIIGAAILMILLSPVMLSAAVLIRLETSGPILFRQQRFGIGGRAIEVLKFRTMHAARCDSSGANATIANDPRVTPLGRVLRRLSIDELPQLLNVLRGDMSLVGPRPHPLHMRVEGAYYQDIVGTYRVRHRVKPGITGWAQINGSRGVVDTREKAQRRVALDLWYLNNWSLLLDARILLLTLLGGFASLSAD